MSELSANATSTRLDRSEARSPTRLPRLVGALLPIVGLSLLVGCSTQDGDGTPARRTQATRTHLVSAITTERTRVSTSHERPGSLRYRRLARLFSQEEGGIVELTLFEGDRVSEGQLLVRLDDDLLRAQLDKARATLEQAGLDLQRLEDLRSRRSVSEAEVSLARTASSVAEAEVRLLETRLAFTRIHAPFAGVITERLIEPGDFVTKNTHLLSLADPASLVAEVYASELIIPHLQVGDPARVRIDALGDQEYPARVLRIHPSLETSSRQGIVELSLDQIPEGARAGQFVRATLEGNAVERLMVPFRALRRDREGELVWVIDADGQATRRSVRSGLQIGDTIAIREGLEPGEQVITRGFLGLSEGKTLKVVSD